MKKNHPAERHVLPVRPTHGLRHFRTALHKKIALFFVAVTGAFSMQLHAQDVPPTGEDPCKIDACLVNSINISTGYDQVSGTYNTPLAQETNWTLVGVPTNSYITLPAPCWDITPHPAWSSFANATWVSPFQNSLYSVNNWPQNAYGAFEFEKCFCVCRTTDYMLDFELMCDDGAEIFLDGTPIATALLGYQFQWARRLIVHQIVTLAPGTHCLKVKLYNSGAVAMGFALEGTLTGPNLLAPKCCNATGRICGNKLWDKDCDGAVDPSTDLGLAGWTIELRDAGGTLIATTVTDAYGNYCFNDLVAGNYIVDEVLQPGWTQSVPGGPGTYNISLVPGGVVTAYFGNCGTPPPVPCEFELKYTYKINDCAFTGTGVLTGLPFGYEVVAAQWTFGDGTSATGMDAIHYYNAPGIYTVCLKVTIFDGTQCCTKTYCRDIRIDKRCDHGCQFEGGINISFNPFECIYTFSANITFAGQPITGWFWDFGDGTTGTGTPINHQFPGPGNYTVCLYVFSVIDGAECCWKKFCKDITVDCNPCGGSDGTTGDNKSKDNNKVQPGNLELTDKNFVILNQNAPNPFAESTVITYNIQQTFTKAEIVFTNVDGRVIKSYNISQKGEGRLNVFASDLSSGVYLYSLIIDGRTIESKRMLKH